MFWSSRVASVNFSAALISLAALTVTGTSATAQTYDWSGFSVYAGIGAGKLDADVTVNDESHYHPKRLSCDPIKKKPMDYEYDGYKCSTKGKLPHGIAKNVIESDSSSNFNFLGTAGIAADFEFTPGFVIGAFADADISNASVDFFGSSKSRLMSKNKYAKRRPRGAGETSIVGELEQDWSFSLGGRLGMLTPNRQGMIYVLAAYTQVHMDSSTATIQNSLHIPKIGVGHAPPIFVSMPTTFEGLTLGVGGELKLTNNWSLKAEGRYTNLNSKSVGYSGRGHSKTALGVYEKKYGPGSCNHPSKDCQKNLHMYSRSKGTIDVDPDVYSARVVLSYRFN